MILFVMAHMGLRHDTCIWPCCHVTIVPCTIAQNRFLLGMHWNSRYYVDTCLPFGMCSVPKVFIAVTDDLQSIFLQQGLQDLLYYLDDFLFLEP